MSTDTDATTADTNTADSNTADSSRRTVSPAELDRAIGAVLWSAYGDALGAGYEYATPPGATERVEFRVGTLTGGAPGTWTDDSELSICVLRGALRHEPHSDAGGDAIAAEMAGWHDSDPADIGLTTLGAFATGGRSAETLTDAARAHLERTGRGAGNGSLMRTGAVAVAYITRAPGPELDTDLATAARGVSNLTHADDYAGDACVLWTFAVDRAIRAGTLSGVDDGFAAGVAALPERRRAHWQRRIDGAAAGNPNQYTPNGYVADAFSAALASIRATQRDDTTWALDAIETAVRVGDDTDTTAAITGALAGAVCGATAISLTVREQLRGWPSLDADGLARLAATVALRADGTDRWPAIANMDPTYAQTWDGNARRVALRTDPGLQVGNVFGLADTDADVAISLCRIGADQRRATHHEVFCIDSPDPDANPNLDTMLVDVADTIAAHRAAGRRVYLHCVEGVSRTPTFAAAYLILHHGHTAASALAELDECTHRCAPNPTFLDAIARVEERCT